MHVLNYYLFHLLFRCVGHTAGRPEDRIANL